MPMVCMLSVVLNSGLQTQKLSPGAGTGEDLLASRLAVEVFARVLREGGSGKNSKTKGSARFQHRPDESSDIFRPYPGRDTLRKLVLGFLSCYGWSEMQKRQLFRTSEIIKGHELGQRCAILR